MITGTEITTVSRKIDIDWLRVMGTLTIFLYHCARYFNFSDWHVKNTELSILFHLFVVFTGQWIMPLFFLLSAVGTYYGLSKRSSAQFIFERFRRLVVPLVFGIFIVLIPVQVYIERVSHGEFSGSFIDFYPRYFEGFYAFGGNFAWMGLHLWYLEILFIFSLVLLPLLVMIRGKWFSHIIDKGIGYLRFPCGYLTPALLIFPAELFNNFHLTTFGRREFGGWGLLAYLAVFICGYVFMTNPGYRTLLERNRRLSLWIGIMVFTTGYFLFHRGFSDHIAVYSFFRSLNTWAWLAAIFGYAGRYLKTSNRVLAYALPAVMPFYVLHQTAIVILGYFLIHVHLPIAFKFFLLVPAAFLGIMICYECIIKRNRGMQLLFGMKRG